MKTAIYFRPTGVIQQVCSGPDVAEWPEADGLSILLLDGDVSTAGKHVTEGENGPELTDGILDTRTLAEAKAAAKLRINAAWKAADESSFAFAGQEIACDSESRKRIESMNGHVTLFGAFPQGWPGEWKAISNEYAPIADAAAWKAFYGAMVLKGLSNFSKAQTLKATIDAAQSLVEVDAVAW